MVPCNRGHQFLHPSPDQASIVAEWSLVCERAHLLPVLSLAYLTGLLVGGLTLGWLADSLGRRPVMLACLYSQCLLAIATHWVTRIEVFLAIRAAQGLLVTGLQVIKIRQDVFKKFLLQGDNLHLGPGAGEPWVETCGNQRLAAGLEWRWVIFF